MAGYQYVHGGAPERSAALNDLIFNLAFRYGCSLADARKYKALRFDSLRMSKQREADMCLGFLSEISPVKLTKHAGFVIARGLAIAGGPKGKDL